jgi:hypothetical protein
MLPHPRPRLPVGGELFPIYIPVGEETSSSPSPNRGIPHGESGIGSPLPSLGRGRERQGDRKGQRGGVWTLDSGGIGQKQRLPTGRWDVGEAEGCVPCGSGLTTACGLRHCTKDWAAILWDVTPGFKEQSRVHFIHTSKKTTYIITECIEINVTIKSEYLLHSGSLTK